MRHVFLWKKFAAISNTRYQVVCLIVYFFVCLFVCLLPVEEVCHNLRSGEDDDRHQIVCFLFTYLFQWFFLSRFLSVAYFFWLHLFVTCLRSLPPSPELRGQ